MCAIFYFASLKFWKNVHPLQIPTENWVLKIPPLAFQISAKKKTGFEKS